MEIAVRAGNTELANKFNHALDTIKANGIYQSINDKLFPPNKIMPSLKTTLKTTYFDKLIQVGVFY